MEKLKAEFSRELYDSLPELLRAEITVTSVQTEEFKEDSEWVELKEISNKAFRALKKREYQLREHLSVK